MDEVVVAVVCAARVDRHEPDRAQPVIQAADELERRWISVVDLQERQDRPEFVVGYEPQVLPPGVTDAAGPAAVARAVQQAIHEEGAVVPGDKLAQVVGVRDPRRRHELKTDPRSRGREGLLSALQPLKK